jgi:UDP-N-acetylmuramoyl-tripeptide--D-alanyl-D-alanine ligase
MRTFARKIILKIITLEASLILKKHKPFIVAVTGNLGKTTTKDSIFAAISDLDPHASQKSFNSEVGIPLTIFREDAPKKLKKWVGVIWRAFKIILQKDYPKFLVLEIGADKKGDIEQVTEWLKPNVTVITQFSEIPVHVENFKNREELVREKQFLAEALSDGGILIYNSDCKDSNDIAAGIKNQYVRKISFGKNSGDYYAQNILSDIKKAQVYSKIVGFEKDIILECDGVVGESPIMCAIPGLIIADLLNIDIDRANAHIKNMKRPNGRMRVLAGKNNSILIDDSYNASPLATEHGIKTLGDIKGGFRKVAILGDMLELGEYTKEAHLKIGAIVAKHAHILIAVGTRARDIAEGAMQNGMGEGWILCCDNSREAAKEAYNILEKNDLIYIKGSQGMRMERITKFLLREDYHPKEFLVRQEDEWLKK